MTEAQQKVLDFFSNNRGWVSTRQIVEYTGLAQAYVNKLLAKRHFIIVEKRHNGLAINGKPAVQYRFVDGNCPEYEAIMLSKQYPGMFGQLYWGAF